MKGLNKKTNKLYARMKKAQATLTSSGKRSQALLVAYKWGVWSRSK